MAHHKNDENTRYTQMQRTEYSGAGPNCSVDSRFGSLPPRNSEMSSDVDRLKQLPIFGDFFVYVFRFFGFKFMR